MSINRSFVRNERRLTDKTLFDAFGLVGELRHKHSGLRVQWSRRHFHQQEFVRNERRLTDKTLFGAVGPLGELRHTHSGLRLQRISPHFNQQAFCAERTTAH